MVPGEGWSTPTISTANTGLVPLKGGLGGGVSAERAGAIAVYVRLSKFTNDGPSSRGDYVEKAFEISVNNGMVPVFFSAPSSGSMLAAEISPSRTGGWVGHVEQINR